MGLLVACSEYKISALLGFGLKKSTVDFVRSNIDKVRTNPTL
jgi:hypothetical protein